MAEGAMYFLPPGIELAKRRQEEAKKRRGGLMELIARGVMAPGNILQQEITNLPQSVGGAAAQAPEVLEALRGLDTLISGYEVSEPQTPLAGPFPGEEGFMGPVNQRAQAPEPAPGDLNFMGPVDQPGATPSRRDRFAGLADIPPGGFTPPGQDRMDRIASAAEQSDEGETNRMLLALAEGLTRAGAEASNVRSISDILAGQARRPTQSLSADMLAKVRELSEQRDTKRLEDAKNPIVDLINKEYGTSFKTPDEAREFMSLRKTQADIEETKGQTAARKEALDLKKQTEQQERAAEDARKKLLSEGRLSGLNDKQKTDIEKRRQDFLGNTRQLRENLVAADRGIRMAEDADINGMRFYANAVLIARAQGEVGNLSQTEQDIYRNIPGLEGRVAAVKDWLTSQISQGRIDAITDILQEIKDATGTRLMDAADGETSAYLQLNEGVDPTAVRRYMVAGMPIEVANPDEQEVEMITPEGEIKSVKREHVEILKSRAGWEERT